MLRMKNLKGCGTALVTPFKANQQLDEDALIKLVKYQLKEGIDFLVPCGSTGESATLSLEEHLRVVEIVKNAANKKVPVIAGAGGNNTQKAIEMAREVEKLGVDGLLTVTPYYNKPNQEGLYQHFKAVADSVHIPIILYNVPPRTCTNMLPETVLRLSKIENIVGIKEATGDVNQISDQAMLYPDDFVMLSGDDVNTLPIIALGGKGLISVASNEIPKSMTEFTHLCLKGKFEEARHLQKHIYPLLKANFIEVNPIPVKFALSMMGMIEENYRLPLVPMSQPNKEKVKKVLTDLNLI
jgi:4-hydroxy-tetrahydrodipicolinate synthase